MNKSLLPIGIGILFLRVLFSKNNVSSMNHNVMGVKIQQMLIGILLLCPPT